MKAIKNYEGFYSISTKGDVYSHRANRFMKPSSCKKGYLRVTLTDGLIKETKLIHRLVAEAFIPNPENKPCVNHLDKDKKNNSVKNLEWCTYLENNLHSLEDKEVGYFRKYDIDFCHKVCKYTMDGWRAKDIANSLGVSPNVVNLIIFTDTYKFVRDEYDWENRPTKSASVNDETVIEICKLLQEGKSYKEIEDLTGVTRKKISNIKRRVTYKHISEGFYF